ncbi:phosphopantetheine-binding protein [Endozoicomonas gorgoniicola]|uniref:Phosphopantetheine-binding protein n=1 Tax=Endozoicomonas gorgoniicola TaxID=1234144 RepID=A0ABT3N052_9GAMM|nr:phosphopantetheine-binding protein [Endozoicomonas gorgoniicola]MCW7555001.1 phosphopantetheine-binding protein [Endozoicomonas gorgoniicola]
MPKIEELNALLETVLEINTSHFDESTELLGALPEFDSMAVVGVITALEESFGIDVADDDIDATIFETVGSLLNYVNQDRS